MTLTLTHLASSLIAAHGLSFEPPFDNPVLVFTTVLLLILFVPIIARKARLPDVIGLLLAGILVGPFGLGLLERPGAIELLGKVGLIYIMFTAGLEIDLNGFIKHRNRSLVFGGFTFVLPMASGFLLGMFVFPDLFPPGWVLFGSLLLASTIASHTLLSYPDISKLGLSQNSAVTTALGGTIITDTLALLVLAIVAAMKQGDPDMLFWARLLGGMVVFTAFVLVIIPRISRWFFRVLEGDGPSQYLFALTTVFFVSTLAMVAGMEDIIGAFFAGLAINRLIPHRSTLMDRIDFVGSALFIPIFLLSVGMLVDPKALIDPYILAIAGGLLVVLFLAKFAAAWATARIFKYSFDEGMIIFSLSIAQAAATLAAVFVGMQIEIFDERMLNASVAVILVSCIVSPLVANRYGRKVALLEEETNAGGDELPQRLLIPLANPNTTHALMSVAIMMHDPKSREPLYPLTVAIDGDNVEERVAIGEKNLDQAIQAASAANVPVKPITKVELNVADGIKRAVVENRIRSLLIGWNGQISTKDRIFGSILDRLIEQLDETIFVYRHVRPTIDHSRIVVAIPPFATRQAGFREAIHEIRTLADQVGGKLHVITPRDNKHALSEAFKSFKPAISAQWTELTNWESVMPELQRSVQPSDLVILMAARPGSIAYSADLDRMPRQLAQRFEENSFLVVYPRNRVQASYESTVISTQTLIRRLVLRGGETLVMSDDCAVEEKAIARLVGMVPGAVNREKIAGEIAERARTNSIRITSGTVFLDLQSEELSISSLIIGNTEEGGDGTIFKTLDEPVNQVWMLVTGQDVTPEQHEELTARISQALRNATPEQLRAITSRDALYQFLDHNA